MPTVDFWSPALPQRFWDKVAIEPNTGCWLWLARIDEDGYGRFGWNRKNRYAHRIGYEQSVAPLPAKTELDHLCRQRCCVNPAHLEPVTHRENMMRSESPSVATFRMGVCVNGHPYTPGTYCRDCLRESGNRRRRREGVARRGQSPTCRSGHAFTPENTRINREGARICKTCQRASGQRHREKKARVRQ